MVLVVALLPLFRGLIVLLLAANTHSFSIFGAGDEKDGGKYKCFSTYELVQVIKYDVHYDEVRLAKLVYFKPIKRPLRLQS